MTAKTVRISSLSALTISASTIALSSPSVAQEADIPEDELLRASTVTVTATRREESVQEVPIAVSVIGGDTIETIKPRDLQDLSGLAPNVVIGSTSATPGGGAIYIRGQGYQDIEKTQNPAVGVSVDGIFLGTNTGQLIDAFDVEQIEVSRGPQGIFFGKNTTGGVINVQRSKPTREYGFRGSAAYGSNNEAIFKGVGNVPVGDNGGLKIGATYRESDGYQENIFTGEDAGGFEYFGINAAIDYDLTEWLNAKFIYDRFDLDGGGNPVQYGNVFTSEFLGVTALPNYNPQTGSPAGLEPRQVINDFEDSATLETDILNLTFTADTPLGELVSVTGYIDSADFVSQDFDGTCFGQATCSPDALNLLLVANGGVLHTTRDQTYEQLTQELRLAGSVGKIDYLGGLYYYEHDIVLDQTTNGAVFQAAGEMNESISLFGNLDYALTDRLTVSAGLRYIEEDKDFFTGYDVQATPTLVVPLIPQITDDASFDDTITRLAIDWQATDQTLLYLSRSEGFRSGGLSIRGTLSEQIEGQNNCVPDDGDGTPGELLCPDNNFLTYEPETVTAWEAGVKTTLFDNQLVFNAALFQTEIEGLQLVSIVVSPDYGPGTNTYINNLDEASTEGLEIEFQYMPNALEGFTLAGSLGLLDGEVDSGVVDGRRTQVNPDGTAGGTGTTVDFSGTAAGLPRIADYSYNLNGTYRFGLGSGTAIVSLGYNYIDDYALNQGFGQDDIEPGYGLLNAYIGYEFNEQYSMSLSGRNLTNEDYRVTSLPSVYFQRWADEANWLLELKGSF